MGKYDGMPVEFYAGFLRGMADRPGMSAGDHQTLRAIARRFVILEELLAAAQAVGASKKEEG